MDKYLIFLDYDCFEYLNYFTLICNHNIVRERVPQEEVDDLLNIFSKQEGMFELYIVAVTNSSNWDYKQVLSEIVSLDSDINFDGDQIIELLFDVFGNKYYFSGSDGTIDNRAIKMLYSGRCNKIALDVDSSEDIEFTFEKNKEILHDRQQKTDLAKIIEEKYRGIKNND